MHRLPTLVSNVRVLSRTLASDAKFAFTKDGTTIAAWHSSNENEFPYECTKPLPKLEIAEDDSPLRLKADSNFKQIFKPKSVEAARREMMEMTYTTKHCWFPRARDKKAKKTQPDRPYL